MMRTNGRRCLQFPLCFPAAFYVAAHSMKLLHIHQDVKIVFFLPVKQEVENVVIANTPLK